MCNSNHGSLSALTSATSLAASLVAAQSRRSRDGWTAVYAALSALARGLSHSGLVRRQDCDDLVHACVERLLQSEALFRGESDSEARAFLRTALRRAALDGYRKERRESRKRAAHEVFAFEGVAYDGEGRVVMASIELRRALARCAIGMGRGSLVGELDALGMLGWTERARLDDRALAALLRCAPNALQARRSRLRREVKRACDALLAKGAMLPCERDAVATLVTPERAQRERDEDR